MSSNTIPLILIIAIAFFYVQPSVLSQQTNDYQTCTPSFRCGTISGIGYPFWDSSRPLSLTIDNRCSAPSNNAVALGLSDQIHFTINSTERSDDYIFSNLTTNFGSALAEPISEALDSCSDMVVTPANQSEVKGTLSNVILPNEDEPCQRTLTSSSSFRYTSFRRSEKRFRMYDLPNEDEDELVKVLTDTGGTSRLNNDSFDCNCSRGELPLRCNDGSTGLISGSKSNTQIKIIIGLSMGVGGAVLVVMSCICILKITRNSSVYYHPGAWKSHNKNKEFKMLILNHSHTPQRYSYSEIKKMTKNFACKLGQGGFGGVYKGELSDGQLVAVKVLHRSDNEGEEFLNEVGSISRTSHVNIISLLGYCYDKKKALVYQYMPKGSLDKYTYQQESQTLKCALDWPVLYDVAAGTATGLEYLHRGCNTRIVHLDIKPHNILLDQDFCPKISDFGLAKLCKGKESKVSMLGARGTPGYIAPEVFSRNFGMVSDKSDVYSYGMLILEMVGARKSFDTASSDASTKYFPDWIYEQLELDEISGLQNDITETEQDAARKLILVGLWCIQTNPIDRPNMTRVIEMLEDNSRTLPVPPKPNLNMPARSPSAASLATYTSSGTDEEELPLDPLVK